MFSAQKPCLTSAIIATQTNCQPGREKEQEPFMRSTYLGSYEDPLKSKRITLWNGPKGNLSARIDYLTSNGQVFKSQADLPLVGLPRQISTETNSLMLRSFFQFTHLIPEKDINGMINRVSVHISAKGGLKVLIPFQPGLALGGVVAGETVHQMVKYAEAEAQLRALEEQYNATEGEIEAVKAKIASRQLQLLKKIPPAQEKNDDRTKPIYTIEKGLDKDSLLITWGQQVTKLNEFLECLGEEIGKAQIERHTFIKFQQAIESPVDMKMSGAKVEVRGFETMHFNSNYFRKQQNHEEIFDQISNSSNASGSTANWTSHRHTMEMTHAQTDALANRVYKLLQEETACGVLVINAFITTRHVRTLTNLEYDLNKLEQIFALMDKEFPTEEEFNEHKKYGISNLNGEKCIYILSEAVMGGSFTALVTIRNNSNKNLWSFSSSSSSEETGSLRTGSFKSDDGPSSKLGLELQSQALRPGFSSHLTKNNTWNNNYHSRVKGEGSEGAVFRSEEFSQVNIEFISQGVLPQFGRSIIEREIMKQLNLNPATFKLNIEDEIDLERLEKGDSIAMLKRQMKMDAASLAIYNFYKGLLTNRDSQKSETKIHTLDNVAKAYGDFAQQMAEEKECGVPVGFYYHILTKSEIHNILQQNRTQMPSQIVSENEKQGQLEGVLYG